MTRAEEKAREYAENTMLSVDHRMDVRDAYWDGYEQAEQDFALTWKDIDAIIKLWITVFEERDGTKEELYTEIARRFNELKAEKQ